ncbi:MAG TPA: VRR-NUC domain-containing protein [Noviherbaspirillum sp.]|nr:VRR-NUC domain-containing protein [Noviherbaspirillum sp.]
MKPLRLTRPEPKEAQVLQAVLRALELHPAVAKVWRMNTGAGKLVHGNGASQFIRFGFAGSPDIHGYMADGRALYCEVKRPSGKLKPEQAEFIQNAQKVGCVAFVARSVDDVLKALANQREAA